jgi:hypothetical protein
MHAYEMSFKCQLYPTHIVAILIQNHFESPNTIVGYSAVKYFLM